MPSVGKADFLEFVECSAQKNPRRSGVHRIPRCRESEKRPLLCAYHSVWLYSDKTVWLSEAIRKDCLWR